MLFDSSDANIKAHLYKAVLLSFSIFSCCSYPVYSDEPLKGSVNTTVPNPGLNAEVPTYGVPVMVGPDPKKILQAKIEKARKEREKKEREKKEKEKREKAEKEKREKAELKPPVPKPEIKPPLPKPLIKQVANPDVLPVEFLGHWHVKGARRSVKTLPEFQAGINGIFAGSTTNEWTISGSAEEGYMLSSDSNVSTPLTVINQGGNKAVIKYQHPIRNTMIQEIILLQLGPDGAQFDGIERLKVIGKDKQTQQSVERATVEYALLGTR